MQEGHCETEDGLFLELFLCLAFSLESHYLLRGVVVGLVVGGSAVLVEEVLVGHLDCSFRHYEDALRGQVYEGWLIVHCIETALNNAEEFDLFELLVLLLPCFDLVNELDSGVLVDSVYFKEIGAEAIMFL